MASERRTAVHDPRVLRAIAHPVRNRILSELSSTGPARAADLAADLDIPANQASFHLRQLAKYGLVEEAPEAARDRRDRVWKLVAQDGLSVTFSDLEGPDAEAASAVYRRSARGWASELVQTAYDGQVDPDVVRRITDQAMRLTKDEAIQLGEELDDVLTTWAERTRGRDPGRRTYSVFSIIQPYPPTRRPSDGD